MSIHRDLLPIIFAYNGLAKRSAVRLISRQSRERCESYHYIVLLEREDIWRLFILFVEYNRTDLVAICLKNPRLDPTRDLNYAIIHASERGYLEIVLLLLADKRMDFANIRNTIYKPICSPIMAASWNGHLEVVRCLLADGRLCPADLNNSAIRYASNNDHLEIIQLLLSIPLVYNGALLMGELYGYKKQIENIGIAK